MLPSARHCEPQRPQSVGCDAHVLPSAAVRRLQLDGSLTCLGRLSPASCVPPLCRCAAAATPPSAAAATPSRHPPHQFLTRSHARPQMLGLQRCVYSASNDKFGGTAVVAGVAASAAGHQPQRCPLWLHDGECSHASRACLCGPARDSACRRSRLPPAN